MTAQVGESPENRLSADWSAGCRAAAVGGSMWSKSRNVRSWREGPHRAERPQQTGFKGVLCHPADPPTYAIDCRHRRRLAVVLMKNTDVDMPPGRGLKAFTARHQMVLFVLLSLIISWSAVIPADGALISYGPMIAAFIVLAVVAGRSGVAGLWKQMARWRVGWKWWLLAPGVLIAAHVCALMINIALGARIVNTAQIESLPVYLSAIVLPLLLLGGQWEEPGWMGYAQRRYQERFIASVLKATLVVGIIRVIWHTPLLAYGAIPGTTSSSGHSRYRSSLRGSITVPGQAC